MFGRAQYYAFLLFSLSNGAATATDGYILPNRSCIPCKHPCGGKYLGAETVSISRFNLVVRARVPFVVPPNAGTGYTDPGTDPKV